MWKDFILPTVIKNVNISSDDQSTQCINVNICMVTFTTLCSILYNLTFFCFHLENITFLTLFEVLIIFIYLIIIIRKTHVKLREHLLRH